MKAAMTKRRFPSLRSPSFAVLALLAIPAGWTLWAQTPPDTDPPQIHILESGADLTDGRLFNRAATPVLQVTDASAVTAFIFHTAPSASTPATTTSPR